MDIWNFVVSLLNGAGRLRDIFRWNKIGSEDRALSVVAWVVVLIMLAGIGFVALTTRAGF